MTSPKIDPLAEAALVGLSEIGPSWHEDEQQRWIEMFTAIVVMLYPGKPRRKSRAKSAGAE